MKKLYLSKFIKYGFILLCPNIDVRHVENTIESIKLYYNTNKILIVLPEGTESAIVSKVRKLAQMVLAKSDLVSMLNKGLELSLCGEWNFVLHRMGRLNPNIEKQFSYFMESEKDIIYPISRRKWDFTEFDLNGFLINKKTYEDVGPFPDGTVEESRTFWAIKAIEKGCLFKGINAAFLN